MRGCDEPVIAGDTTKFRRLTGWKQEIDLMMTVRDMIDWWRTQLGVQPQISATPIAGSRRVQAHVVE